LTVAGRYVDKFIIVLIGVAGLLQVADYSMTYYALHSKSYFHEIGLVASWALSHGNTGWYGWYLMALFDLLFLMFSGVLAGLSYRRYKTLLLPIAAFVSLYVCEIYAVANNLTLLIKWS
jgi:hypothetical protein